MELRRSNLLRDNKSILFIVFACISLYQFAWLIYVPNIPVMAKSLQVNEETIRNSIILYMLGIAISQLFYGPLSDICGRKKLLLIGICIFFLATFEVLVGKSITSLLIGRLIQGLGAGSLCVIGKAIINDIFSNNVLIKANSIIASSTTISPILSQCIGGYVGEYISWKFNFIILLFYSIIVFIMSYYCLPNIDIKRNSHNIRVYFKNNYFKLFKMKDFYIHIFLFSTILLAELLFQLIAPFEMQSRYHYFQHNYVLVVLLSELGILIGSSLVVKFCNKFLMHESIMFGFVFLGIASFLIFLQSYFYLFDILLYLSILIYFTSIGFLLPYIISGSMNILNNCSGAINSLMGGAQMLGVSFLGLVITFVGVNSFVEVSMIMLFMCVLCFHLAKRRAELPLAKGAVSAGGADRCGD